MPRKKSPRVPESVVPSVTESDSETEGTNRAGIFADRTAEAKHWFSKALRTMHEDKDLPKEAKHICSEALTKMFRIVKDMEEGIPYGTEEEQMWRKEEKERMENDRVELMRMEVRREVLEEMQEKLQKIQKMSDKLDRDMEKHKERIAANPESSDERCRKFMKICEQQAKLAEGQMKMMEKSREEMDDIRQVMMKILEVQEGRVQEWDTINECKELLKENKKEMEYMKKAFLKNEEEKKTKEQAKGEETTGREVDRKTVEGCEERMRENRTEVGGMKEDVKKSQGRVTYGSAGARPTPRKPGIDTATYSIVVTSTNEKEQGDMVMKKVKEAVNAREGGLQIENIRRTKDRKIIIGCRTKEEIGKVKERIEKRKDLKAENVKNKDPQIIIKDVRTGMKDNEILSGLRGQNGDIFEGVRDEENRVEIKYRRKSKISHREHVVVQVSPQIWNSVVDAGEVYVGEQKVKVADQSPLIQCSRCLGYGHGKRFCEKTVDVCSHCGGPHLRTQCTGRKSGHPPECINCRAAGLDRRDHDVFSDECPVRNRWDTKARSMVQYCWPQ